MKKEEREAFAQVLPDLLNAVFEQGAAHQRLSDAQDDAQFTNEQVQGPLNAVMELINKPNKSEIN